jgi:hypothetical protein
MVVVVARHRSGRGLRRVEKWDPCTIPSKVPRAPRRHNFPTGPALKENDVLLVRIVTGVATTIRQNCLCIGRVVVNAS